MIMSNLWGSVTVFTNKLVTDMQAVYPGIDIQYMDWETHANVEELPNADLIGPTALTFTEVSPHMIEVNFAIGVSTYGSDRNLFRLRDFVGNAFERMRPEQKIPYYDAITAVQLGQIISTDGTMVAPMSRADARPFQFIQAQCLLEPNPSD